MMYSAYKLNKQGDNIQLWHTRFTIWNQSVPCPVLTVASWPTYRFLRRQVRWSSIPICLRIFHTGDSKYPLPTTQEKTLHVDIIRWSILKSNWYILWSQRWRSSIYTAKTRPGADCGSDHELLIAKFRLKLKKVGKTSRSYRYDLNHIPYSGIIQWKWQIDSKD